LVEQKAEDGVRFVFPLHLWIDIFKLRSGIELKRVFKFIRVKTVLFYPKESDENRESQIKNETFTRDYARQRWRSFDDREGAPLKFDLSIYYF
jgi:hypothetical protein